MKNSYMIKEYYEQLKKLQILRDYTKKIKDDFLKPELHDTIIKSFDNEIKELREKIKRQM